MSEIEKIAEFDDGEKVWRTTCKCMGDDHLTFTVATDDEYPEVYLEFYSDCYTRYEASSWSGSSKWTKPFRTFWNRICGAFTLVFKGYVKINEAFIFRGEEQIDELTDTIQAHKRHLIKRLPEYKAEWEKKKKERENADV